MKKIFHIRRCHKCNGITEVEMDQVLRCKHCGHSLAPFYYFDDKNNEALAENEVRIRPPEGEYFPIYGLTVYWESY